MDTIPYYCEWMGNPPTPLQRELALTLGRINSRVLTWKREEVLKNKVYAWAKTSPLILENKF